MSKLADYIKGIMGNIVGPGKYTYVRDESGNFVPVTPSPSKQYDSVPQPSPTKAAEYTPAPTSAKIPGFKTWEPPKNLADLVLASAIKEGIPPAVLAGVIQSESGFRPDAYNTGVLEDGRTVKARGIAQITDLFHPKVTDEQAYDPNFAIPYAAKMLGDKFKKLNNLEQTIASYYVGNRVGKGLGRDERGLGPKGREYLNKVVKNLEEDLINEHNLLPNYAP